jgi:membrane protein
MATRVERLRLDRVRALARDIAAAFSEHGLFTYASAIAFRALVALVPLTLLGFGLLGALGFQDVWTDSIAPAVQPHVTKPVFEAIDFTVQKIFSSSKAGLIAFATSLLVWDATWGVRAVMAALNKMHEVEETRSWIRVALTAVALAVAVSVCLVGAVLAVVAAPRAGDGALDVVLGLGRWLAAVGLLSLAVGVLVRYAPAERPEVRWASGGSILVIASWVVASLAFSWYVSSIADFKSATGSLTVFLVLTAYVFTSVTVFLVGVELDELLRKEVRRS